jgi:O-antigen ligase
MGPIGADNQEYTHAHNSYLQVFYNFGIIAGVVFLILCAMSLWKGIDIVLKQGRKYSIYFVPVALIVAFGFISLTEWAFHPCIPAGFCFLLMQAVLIKD